MGPASAQRTPTHVDKSPRATKIPDPSDQKKQKIQQGVATGSPRKRISATGQVIDIKDRLPLAMPLPCDSSTAERSTKGEEQLEPQDPTLTMADDSSSSPASIKSSMHHLDAKNMKISPPLLLEDPTAVGRNDSYNSQQQQDPTSSTTLDDADTKYFARSESASVRNLKILVMCVLLVVATGVCVAVYTLTDRGQQEEFEASFAGSAAKVVKSFEDILEQKIASLAAFGVTMTAFALETNSTWPFVTLNKFQERCASSRALSGSLAHSVSPLVTEEQRLDWEAYSVANADWLFQAREDQRSSGMAEMFGKFAGVVPEHGLRADTVIVKKIVNVDFATTLTTIDEGPGPYAPSWQSSPVFPAPRDLVNYNMFRSPRHHSFVNASFTTGQITLGGLDTAPPSGTKEQDGNTVLLAHIFSAQGGKRVDYNGEPVSSIFVPVMDTLDVMSENRKTVAVVTALIRWASYFENILTDEDSDQPLHVVLSNSCQDPVTYKIRGESATFLGQGSQADPKYSDLVVEAALDASKIVIEPDTIALTVNQNLCNYTIRVYPTQEGDDHFNDNFPLFITLIVAGVFVFTMGVFVMYDSMVEKRQRKVLATAKRSTAIVSSMFPRKVRDQLLQAPIQGNATKLRHFANRTNISDVTGLSGPNMTSEPIADLFPECTVMFADVEGFTAWSSVREPSQVFTLLEGIYSAFDTIAARRVVFKVETVGDCYVAVCGLPDPRDDHAVVMARFARECILKHVETVRKLERTLGPETGDLRIRVGLHSGPITAGVLRGERSRFQIFGDTVNTAARIESTGQGNEIHLSEATARIINDAGYRGWIQARDDPVHLKGKGTMSTYWLKPSKNDISSSARTSTSTSSQLYSDTTSDLRKDRLIAWNAELLLKLLKQVIAYRDDSAVSGTSAPKWGHSGTNPLDEVIEVIELPNQATKSKTKKRPKDPSTVTIDPHIAQLVHGYVAELAAMYHDNHFHNFDHASHVTMSVAKLLSRIVAPSDMDFMDGEQAKTKLHDHTYGITSDPLTQFACVLSALIHDADHQGVSNTTLVQEGDDLTQMYGTKSLAEQNSVDRAWDLLMTTRYQPLVAKLCHDNADLKRLRQLVVNSVMATDIMDPDLKKLRNDRWDKAFKNTQSNHQRNGDDGATQQEAINRKATIVIEHLIQASDVSHTMQHWNVYTKWNARLFKEMYKAYIDGRAGAKDPSVFWAKGEIGFFDFYIIPLAKKLKDCGVFGVSSDEYLQYAISNRNEWEAKGEMMVQRLIAEVKGEFGTSA